MKKIETKLKAIDFFCSGGGMSLGMQQAGINVIAGIDCDPECKKTYELI
jgi:DNA (cytosine-5)-methyltransferase 1